MIVKVLDMTAVAGGKALMLCDDDGVALPMQVSCRLDQHLEGSQITVTFHVDGEQVRLA